MCVCVCVVGDDDAAEARTNTPETNTFLYGDSTAAAVLLLCCGQSNKLIIFGSQTLRGVCVCVYVWHTF